MQAYFDEKSKAPLPANLVTVLMLIFGAAGIVVALQIVTGWLPLGIRANILRNDLNFIEWIGIGAGVVYGAACLRTAWGLWQRQRSSWAWSQWVSFVTLLIGLGLVMSVLIPGAIKFFLISTDLRLQFADSGLNYWLTVIGFLLLIASVVLLLSSRLQETLRRWRSQLIFGLVIGLGLSFIGLALFVSQFPDQVPNIRNPEVERLAPGILLFLSGVAAYFYVRAGTESSTENRVAIGLTPGKLVRVQLAKSPSAGAIIGFFAIFFGFVMATDLFLQPTSVASILTNISTKGVIAIGITILMISGEFDLSVGSILGVVSMAFMVFMTEGVPLLNTGPVPEFLAAILALIVAIFLGAINGFLRVTTGIPSFIVTLGTLLAFRAITLVVISGGRILRYRDYFAEFPQVFIDSTLLIVLAIVGLVVVGFLAYRFLPRFWRRYFHLIAVRHKNGDFGTTQSIVSGLSALVISAIFAAVAVWLILVVSFHLQNAQIIQVGFFDIANGRWEFTLSDVTQGVLSITIPRDANFRNSIIWWLIFTAAFHIILNQTRYGNAVFAVGGNIGAARAQGINVNRVKVMNFVLCAFLTGVAAIYEVARNPGVDPLKGEGWELDVIAMTVIGGALLSGGYGSIVGTLLGALIFGMLQTGLVLIGVDARLFQGTVGVIIIVAVVLNTAVRGKQT